MSRIESARLRWEDGVPVAEAFDDFYFNTDGGIEESQHVFLAGNQLEQRFQALASRQTFVIGETGFGTGLNFFTARKLWLSCAPADAQLHYLAFEKYPLSLTDMKILLQRWPDITDCQSRFLPQYPPQQQGFHSLFFDQGRVKLTLIIGDALEQLPQLQASVDAWFLDGFSPDKNPDMWQPALFQQLAANSRPGSTLATFTVARQVREGLLQAGFSLSKRSGFGRKREMLCGQLRDAPLQSPLEPPSQPQTLSQPSAPVPQHLIVVGAGLAGASTARALAEQGISVTLLEAGPEPAQQGSGNAQGALYAKLAVKPTYESAFHLQGLLFSANQLRQLPDTDPPLASLCGVLQLAIQPKDAKRQEQLLSEGHYADSLFRAVSAEQASALAGTQVGYPGLFFPHAGWVAPADYCRYLLDHPAIECHFNQPVQQLIADADHSHWTVKTPQGCFSAPKVIICTAADTRQLAELAHLPVKPIRGQTSLVQASVSLPELHTVVCGEGYISPARKAHYCFGATFDLHYANTELRDSDHQKNLDTLAAALPAFDKLTPADCDGRTGFRCSTPDYLPMVGQVADYDATVELFAPLRTDSRRLSDQPVPRLAGLYVNTGHGSKGLITCPISAALLTAEICGTPAPLAKDLAARLDPARFILRDLIRRRI